VAGWSVYVGAGATQDVPPDYTGINSSTPSPDTRFIGNNVSSGGSNPQCCGIGSAPTGKGIWTIAYTVRWLSSPGAPSGRVMKFRIVLSDGQYYTSPNITVDDGSISTTWVSGTTTIDTSSGGITAGTPNTIEVFGPNTGAYFLVTYVSASYSTADTARFYNSVGVLGLRQDTDSNVGIRTDLDALTAAFTIGRSSAEAGVVRASILGSTSQTADLVQITPGIAGATQAAWNARGVLATGRIKTAVLFTDDNATIASSKLLALAVSGITAGQTRTWTSQDASGTVAYISPLLDGVNNTDTLVGTVARGDLIVGNSTPKWARLPLGTSGYFLKSDGSDAVWSSFATATISVADNLFSIFDDGNNAKIAQFQCSGLPVGTNTFSFPAYASGTFATLENAHTITGQWTHYVNVEPALIVGTVASGGEILRLLSGASRRFVFGKASGAGTEVYIIIYDSVGAGHTLIQTDNLGQTGASYLDFSLAQSGGITDDDALQLHSYIGGSQRWVDNADGYKWSCGPANARLLIGKTLRHVSNQQGPLTRFSIHSLACSVSNAANDQAVTTPAALWHIANTGDATLPVLRLVPHTSQSTDIWQVRNATDLGSLLAVDSNAVIVQTPADYGNNIRTANSITFAGTQTAAVGGNGASGLYIQGDVTNSGFNNTFRGVQVALTHTQMAGGIGNIFAMAYVVNVFEGTGGYGSVVGIQASANFTTTSGGPGAPVTTTRVTGGLFSISAGSNAPAAPVTSFSGIEVSTIARGNCTNLAGFFASSFTANNSVGYAPTCTNYGLVHATTLSINARRVVTNAAMLSAVTWNIGTGTANGETTSVTNMYLIRPPDTITIGSITAGSTTTVTTLKQYACVNPTLAATGTNTITTHIGLYIPNLTSGTTIWAILSEGGKSSHLGAFSFGKNTAPTHFVDIAAGTTAIAPIKLTQGTNLTTPVAGCIEFDGSDYFLTV
jgi:hypothetical protein